VTPLGARAGAGSWQELWPRGERSPCWSRFAGRACDPVGDPSWSSLFLKDCTLWEGPMLGHFMKNCSLWEGLTLEQGRSVRSPPPEEEGVAETTSGELTATPMPCPPVPCAGGGGRQRNGSEVEPRKKGGVGRRCFKI